MAPWTQALRSRRVRLRARSMSRYISSGMLMATFFVATGTSMKWYDHDRNGDRRGLAPR